MKVLWFAVNPSLYDAHRNGEHNGGGWIASLEKIIRTLLSRKSGQVGL